MVRTTWNYGAPTGAKKQLRTTPPCCGLPLRHPCRCALIAPELRRLLCRLTCCRARHAFIAVQIAGKQHSLVLERDVAGLDWLVQDDLVQAAVLKHAVLLADQLVVLQLVALGHVPACARMQLQAFTTTVTLLVIHC